MKSGWPAPNWERENVSLYQCVLQIYLDSSNLEEMLCGLWVLSTSVGGTGSFSAPTVTHSTSGNAHETQSFLLLYGKNTDRTLDTNNLPC